MKFEVQSFNQWDKEISIDGPCQLRIEVDFDDVEREEVEKGIKKMVEILNANWPTDEEYS